MPNKTLLHLSFILATIALASCAQVPPAPTSTSQPPTPTVPPDWQSRWLQKIPCAAPCVEGITPGKTTAAEAVQILSQNPLVHNVMDNPTFDIGDKTGRLSWTWASSQTRGGALYWADDAGLIFSVTSDFGTPYSLADVMRAYGNPDFILAMARYTVSEQPLYCQEARFVYMSDGLSLPSACYSKFDLDESSSFHQIIFFAPTREGYERTDDTPRRHPDWLLPWEGFKGFQYYCRDGVNGRLCRGEQLPP